MSQVNRIAGTIMRCFDQYRGEFQALTAQAQECFEAAQWHRLQALSAARIDLYDESVAAAAEKLWAEAGEALADHSLWDRTRGAYIELLPQRSDFELAETFYNSLYCRVFRHRELNDSHMFLRSSQLGREVCSQSAIFRCYVPHAGLVAMIRQIQQDYAFNIPWENARRDCINLVRYVRDQLPAELLADSRAEVEVIRSVFYRNKCAYIVGRVRNRVVECPFVLPVLNNEAGAVYIDAAISDPNDVSVIFSFARSYFMVDVDVPSEFVRFLQSLVPLKSRAELYSSLGMYKQGKAEFYRDLVDHLEGSTDQFVVAPGIKGMVMMVFTLPSFPVVFKLIKDRFSHSKNVSHREVKEKYRLVKRHDRVGRMADTQEFNNFMLPLERFSPQLLDELQQVAGRSIDIDGDAVIIRHLWTERRMIPLNIFIDDALARDDEISLFHALNEFGKAIKQLAAANIFAGDMLFKNFGVTRHNRVVFYDYDEIAYLTDCNFREIPEPLYPEQELADEPWYSIGPHDVFPEELTLLTACNARVRAVFDNLHGDIFTVKFWQEMQQQVHAGAVVDVFPYRRHQRFERRLSHEKGKKVSAVSEKQSCPDHQA